MNTPSPWLISIAVAGGGAAGALLRHACNQFFLHRSSFGLPVSTWAVNVAGCFSAGLLLVWLEGRGESATLWRALLITGVLGGLTTFSAFGLELWQWLRDGRYGWAIILVAAHVIAGVAAIALGWRVGRMAAGV